MMISKSAYILTAFSFMVVLSSASRLYRDQHNEPEMQSTIIQFDWLMGSWSLQTKKGTMYEKWWQDEAKNYKGYSFILSDTRDTTWLEHVNIEAKDQHIFYVPTTYGQNDQQPVLFKMTKISERGFIAENAAHDFPTRIEYRSNNDTTLYVVIDGKINGEYRKQEFNFTRNR